MADINVTLTIDDGLDADIQVGTCVDQFTDLTDGPGAIVANEYLKGNAGGTALEFGNPVGGTNTQIQFNDSSVLAGASRLTWNKATNRLDLGTSIIVLAIKAKIFVTISNDGNQNGIYDCNLSDGNDHIVTANGNLTLGLVNLVSGMGGIIVLKIDNVGGYTITLDPAVFTTELNGSDAIDTVANKKNIISYWYDGTYVYYSITNEA